MDAACHRGKNLKYAANSEFAEHTGMPQRLYLRFLCAKRAVCSWVPEFAAYFRAANPEVRGKTEIGRPDPGFAFPRPAVLLPNIGLCSAISDFSPHFRKNVVKPSTRKRETRQTPLGKQPLNAKTAFRRFPRTKPDIPSQGLITVETLRNNPMPVNHYPDGMTTVELNRKADLRQVKWPPYSASSNILNNALCIGIQVLHAEAKRLPIECFVV